MFPDAKLGIGPVTKDGFYYDFDLPKNLTPDQLPKLEKRMREFVEKDLIFKKTKITFDEALKIFSAKDESISKERNQPYKMELINELRENKQPITIYTIFKKTKEHPSFECLSDDCKTHDLCAGPHIKSTREINPDAFKLTKIAGAYWKGEEKNKMLTRIYGVAFETKKELNNYLKLQEELEKRDHRVLGPKLDLFSLHDFAPGAAFWHPRGMIIIKELEKLWREIHDSSGYLETSTPILVKNTVFQKSGHWDHYRENMFFFENENEIYALKPMNCPESTYLYSSKIRSYKDLPLRFSEIGRLHRNELSGTLTGLFRVRQITMDDAHIYCRPDQIFPEVTNVLKLIKKFYKIFKLEPYFYFSTRPKNSMGDPKLWNKAEYSLEYALKKNKLKYEIKPNDGAFYGPKIDVEIKDVLGRSWQISTIQLDFQMPEKFNLYYIDEKGKKQKPVMIHRAIFGSFERFIGILLEHCAGAFPLWLSPEQVWIIPIGSNHKKYANQILKTLKNPISYSRDKIRASLRDENETVGKKIREAEIQKIPYVLVIGDREVENKTARVRARGKGDIGEMKIEEFLEKIGKEITAKK